MRTLLLVGAFALAMVAGSATEGRAQEFLPCQVGDAVTHGCVMTANVMTPGQPGPQATGSRTGQACAWNVLRLVAWGDVRVATAMRNGGISELSSVDGKTFELVPYWGVLTRYCTVVSGN